MKRMTRTTAVLIATAVVISFVGQRLVGAEFSPAAAHEPTPAAASVLPTSALAAGPAADFSALVPARGRAHPAAVGAVEPVALEAPVSVPVTAAEPTVAPVVAPASSTPRPAAPTAPPAPVRTAAPTAPPPAPPAPTVAPSSAPTAVPATCPATWFCYPRLGIAGAIVPYTDCGGTTDIGTSIRSFTCLSPFYLMGHAYTQFGKITQWRAGDIVVASGRQFTITGAFTQSSCEAPARAIAPLSLQTSLTSGGCGSVLVVQGN
jgi:hypothetical protein